jgi:hypothetical protein
LTQHQQTQSYRKLHTHDPNTSGTPRPQCRHLYSAVVTVMEYATIIVKILCFWTLSFCFYLKHNVSDTGLYLRLQVKPIQLDPTETLCFKMKTRQCFRKKTGWWIVSRNITFILIYHRHKLLHLNYNRDWVIIIFKYGLATFGKSPSLSIWILVCLSTRKLPIQWSLCLLHSRKRQRLVQIICKQSYLNFITEIWQ